MKLKVIQTSWSGWEDEAFLSAKEKTQKEEPKAKEFLFNVAKKNRYVVNGILGELSFEIIKIKENEIEIKTTEKFCLLAGNGKNMTKVYDKFVVSRENPLSIETPTFDMGDSYHLILVDE